MEESPNAMTTWDRYAFRYLSAAALTALVGGTIFYHFIEHWSWVNAYYFCVITLTTIGYGDIVPKTDFGKIFTTFYALIGIGIITAFITAFIRRRGQKMRNRRDNQDS